MALWIDGSMPSLADLQRYDSGLVAVASTEGIDVEEKIAGARAEISTALDAFLASEGSTVRLDQIVATEALTRWAIAHSLALTYRDAHFHHLSERHKGNWKAYESEARTAMATLFQLGVGFTSAPLRRPAKPGVSTASGTQPAASYFVRISWVNALGGESEASDIQAFVQASPGGITVTPVGAPANATGFHVFAGNTADAQFQQNASPLALPGSWTLPGGGLTGGRAPGAGQPSEGYVRRSNRLNRG